MSMLPSSIRPRLSQLLRMLGSDIDAEALSAARALHRTLVAESLSLHDLADAVLDQPTSSVPIIARPIDRPPRWDDLPQSLKVAWLDALLGTNLLSPWETKFTRDMRQQTYQQPHKWRTPHQCAALNKILVRGWAEGVRP